MKTTEAGPDRGAVRHDRTSAPIAGDYPLVRELTPAPGPHEVFGQVCHLPYCLWLDSALRHPQLGRYSFIAADPCRIWRRSSAHACGQGHSHEALWRGAAATVPELPPFQGGFAGLLGYAWGRTYERLPQPGNDEFKIPALVLGLYDVVFAWDHAQDRAWVLSQGFPETEPAARRHRAHERLQVALGWLRAAAGRTASRTAQPAIRLTTPQYENLRHPGIVSNFSSQGYCTAVQQVIDYIHAGDVFQVNLSQRLLRPADDDSVSLYLRLRQRSPATFSAYFDAGDFQVISASPERFLQVRERRVEARPIKGTRRIWDRPEADMFAAAALRDSDKDRAENIMIVDLLRNDLSRVCTDESVCVEQLCEVESYGYVQHLVSAIGGTLCDDCGPWDLIAAAFPGGSITGAPKVRAMEIINELENVARGAYCGSLGYVGLDGTMDLSILIRTITAAGGWWQLPVGGGVVAQSVPALELEETWHKAAGLLRAMKP